MAGAGELGRRHRVQGPLGPGAGVAGEDLQALGSQPGRLLRRRLEPFGHRQVEANFHLKSLF
jgi:hypothetical protein